MSSTTPRPNSMSPAREPIGRNDSGPGRENVFKQVNLHGMDGQRALLGMAALAVALVLGLFVQAAWADHGDSAPTSTTLLNKPYVIIPEGNQSCGDLDDTYAAAGTTWSEIKFEGNELVAGTTKGGVTISNLQVSGAGNFTFDWSSTIGIDAVFVKQAQGPISNIYVYQGQPGHTLNAEATGDTGLGPVPGAEQSGGVSHISFCYDAGGLTTTSLVTELHDANEGVVAIGSTVPFGSTIHDSATVTPNTATGTVIFKFFENGTCTEPAEATSAALPLAGGTVDATGFAQGPLAAGDYSFLATYSGSATHAGDVADCEPFRVAERPAAVVNFSKTADGSFTRTYSWTISKTVVPTDKDMFRGDTQVVEWRVAVDKTTADSDFTVSGTITIANDGPGVAVISDLTDSLAGVVISNCRNESLAAVDPVSGSVNLAEDDTIVCDYTANLGDTDPGDGTNSASVEVDSVLQTPATDAYDFDAAPTVVGFDAITVDDTNPAGPQDAPASADTTFTYGGSYTCDAGEGEYPNAATIVETNQTANALVTIDCFALEVTKTANTRFDRACDWDIVKTGDETELSLEPGETAEVNYDVDLTVECLNSDFNVSGDIDVYNPAPIAATINSVSDLLGGNAITVDCGATVFPYTLASLGTLTCSYDEDLTSLDSLLNTATATLQNYSYSIAGVATPNGTTNFSGSANVTFGEPANHTNACIDVTDDNGTPANTADDVSLGTVCEEDAPKKFEYSVTISAENMACTEFSYTNVASFVSQTRGGDTGSDNHVVDVTVLCEADFCKFYDANVDGIWNLGEVALEGWLITVNGTAYYTGADGCVTVMLESGDVTATEGLPSGWVVTTEDGKTVTFTEAELLAGIEWEFGNVCLGEGGGHTLGFWSNKNGEKTMNDAGGIASELALLNGLKLVSQSGADAPTFSTHKQFRTWLLAGNSTNMAYMLSVQLAAMTLNVEAGFVDGDALVWDGTNFVTINALTTAANNALLADQVTLSGDPNRATQAALKDALDDANNNKNFVQAEPCDYEFASFIQTIQRWF